jgi:hypothetical protein
MYFAFMDHFTLWLIPTGLFGLAIAVWNYVDLEMDGEPSALSLLFSSLLITSLSVDNNLIIPIFSIFLIAWAILFGQYWKQTSSSFACNWGTLGKTGRDIPREDFHGTLVKSKVTGLMEKQYAWYKRIPFYFLSILVTGVMLCVAFAVMVISLNLQVTLALTLACLILFSLIVRDISKRMRWVHTIFISQLSPSMPTQGSILIPMAGDRIPMSFPLPQSSCMRLSSWD